MNQAEREALACLLRMAADIADRLAGTGAQMSTEHVAEVAVELQEHANALEAEPEGPADRCATDAIVAQMHEQLHEKYPRCHHGYREGCCYICVVGGQKEERTDERSRT